MSSSPTRMAGNTVKPETMAWLLVAGGALEGLEGFYERHPDTQDNILKSDNVSQNAPRKPLIWSKDTKEGFRILLLIIFLVLIVSYALWQSFIVHGFK